MKHYIITVHSFYGSSVEAVYPHLTFGPFVYKNEKEADERTENLNDRLDDLGKEMLAQYHLFDLNEQNQVPDSASALLSELDFDNDEEEE